MGLTIAAAVAVLAVAAALVIRAARPAAPVTVAPFDPTTVTADSVALPAGEHVQSLGAAPGALLLLTRDPEGAERIRLIDPETGATVRTIAVSRQ